ncbi:hypothetical protein DL89DRAFT_119300 [Linderina pennispora]|uniref:Uncharacterized protein n=1 Tax=Linderina pennispora TaxID=61395 RepID=A0A1Y1VVB1_9FUNG|nr:uncharacterized protein DL89DRAFT_119300 [Linderina pennispora]ORX65241.1 hypothetical protein DL89DRAFT_119300 [Linderina pennispora]
MPLLASPVSSIPWMAILTISITSATLLLSKVFLIFTLSQSITFLNTLIISCTSSSTTTISVTWRKACSCFPVFLKTFRAFSRLAGRLNDSFREEG